MTHLLNLESVALRTFKVLAIGWLLTGCLPADEQDAENAIYRHSLPASVQRMDPLHASDRYSGFMIQNVFESLYRYQYLGRPYTLIPELANGMPKVSADGLEVTIVIASGHYFSNSPEFSEGQGREVNAHDVAYSLRRHFDPSLRSEGAWLWRDWLVAPDPDNACAQICATDDAVTFHLRRPFPFLAATLATPFAAIVPQEVVDALGEEFTRAPIGSGPYQLDHIDEFSASLSLNPNYHRPRFSLEREGFQQRIHPELLTTLDGLPLPLMEMVEIAFVADEAARILAFDGAGSLDLIRLPAAQVHAMVTPTNSSSGPSISLNANYADLYNISVAPELGFLRMDFNMADPDIGHAANPSNSQRNRRLRCAVLAADSWQQRTQQLYAGMGEVFRGVVPPQAGAAPPTTPAPAASFGEYYPLLNYGAVAGSLGRYEFDFFKTQLVNAGYPGGNIRFYSFATLGDLIRGIRDLKVNVFMTGWAMDYPDAMNNLQLFYGPNRLPGANYSSFNNPGFNNAFAKAELLPDSPSRTKLLTEMANILNDECVTLSGMARQAVFLNQKNVTALPDSGPMNGLMLRFVFKDPNSG